MVIAVELKNDAKTAGVKKINNANADMASLQLDYYCPSEMVIGVKIAFVSHSSALSG